MGITLRVLRRALLFLAGLFTLTAVFIALFAIFQAKLEPETFASADVIVVLGAGMDTDGTLHRPSILRVKKAVALFSANAAPRLRFSGGEGKINGPAAGEMMAKLAVSMGVPRAAISTENRSFSTLQNALFSMSALQNSIELFW